MPTHWAVGSAPRSCSQRGLRPPAPAWLRAQLPRGWCIARSWTYIKKAARAGHGGPMCALALSLGAGRARAVSTQHAEPSRERPVPPREPGVQRGTRGDTCGASWGQSTAVRVSSPGVPGEVGAKQGPPSVVGAEGGSGRRGPARDQRSGKRCPWRKEGRAGLSCGHSRGWGVRAVSLATSRTTWWGGHLQGRRRGQQQGSVWVQRSHQGHRVGHGSAGGTGLEDRVDTAGRAGGTGPLRGDRNLGGGLDSSGRWKGQGRADSHTPGHSAVEGMPQRPGLQSWPQALTLPCTSAHPALARWL